VEPDIEVRMLRPDDSAGLAACIERCYGDSYLKRVLYRADDTAALIRGGDYAGVVAVAHGEIVGHIGHGKPTPAATVLEAGTTIVDPRLRGQGVMARMASEWAASLVAAGATGFIHFPTTAHTMMQRAATANGGRETGILLACVPESTRDRSLEAPGAGRLTVTVVYQPLAAAPAQSIFVPSLYRDRIGGLAEALQLDREILEPGDADAAASEIASSEDDARSLTSIVIERAGADLSDELAGLLARAETRLIHVDLAMNDPGIGAAVDVLRGNGFAYGAWLPGWRGHDVLRAQLVREPTDEELAPTLYTGEAVAMCSSIRRELTGGT
jgi:hypothetical protein